MHPDGAVGEWLLVHSFVLSALKLSAVEASDSALDCGPGGTGYA